MSRIVRESISDRFSKFITLSIVCSIFTLLVGALFLFLPQLSNKVIGIISGIIFILSGINTIYKYFKRNGAKLYSLNLIYGLIMVLTGIIIVLVPFSVTTFLTICLGVYLIICGVNKITYGVWFKIGNDSSFLITIVIGIMSFILGILVLANPFSYLTVTQVIGTFLILYSILDITDLILLKKRSNEITKIFW